ncbi:MAG: phosphoenolpyruvate carboxykinase (GTP), partial [Candidatus Omnitrophica bacterium]|nr:phosphoenolpyruvate carboxykinase (GTP) [Candidatus Omnitrophota bacterium]
NSKTNPNMVATIKKDTIYTNVLLKPDGTVWWEGADEGAPEYGINWQGKPWRPGMTDEHGNPIKAAHANSRFTAPIVNCPTASFRLEQHHGVPISAIIFGGKRAHLAPLVYESFNWQHGVFVGSTMASELTAAQVGKLGQVRRDPMAMIPFCGYNMAAYFRHWLDMGKNMRKAPRIFHVNWFRTDDKGRFMWPGFGENLRVMEWVLQRCFGNIESIKTPIGYIPKPQDLDMTGLKLSTDAFESLFEIDKKAWLEEAKEIKRFFKKFNKNLPPELWQEYEELLGRLRS